MDCAGRTHGIKKGPQKATDLLYFINIKPDIHMKKAIWLIVVLVLCRESNYVFVLLFSLHHGCL